MTDYLRNKWLLLRKHRTKGSVMFDYKILKNFSRLMRMGK